MSIMFLYYSEERAVRASEVQAHTTDTTNLISTGEFLMRYPSLNDHMPASCHDEFFKVGFSPNVECWTCPALVFSAGPTLPLC